MGFTSKQLARAKLAKVEPVMSGLERAGQARTCLSRSGSKGKASLVGEGKGIPSKCGVAIRQGQGCLDNGQPGQAGSARVGW